MSNRKKIKSTKESAARKTVKPAAAKKKERPDIRWMIAVMVVTAVAYIPMLRNGLTNWDDEYYVVQNALLRGPDWAGIFSKPIVSNYHPVTIATLAANYAMTGLDASSYLITNWLLHLINTGLVFYFTWLISRGRSWVALITSLIFGVHPMHVESVAWVSERKDLLYTLFFLLSLIQYWYYLGNRNKKNLIYCFIFFVLSIFSKPAAIILPLLLFLLDYWFGHISWKKKVGEKVPFLILSVVMAIVTVKLQSRTAIAGLDFYPLWSRFFFACYTSMMYIIRFFVPYPLSAFHPFPATKALPLPLMLSPIFMIGLLVLVWFKRKNKLIVFSFLFFMINLILVVQIVSIGGTLLAERYTYVPYIGAAFLIGMLLDKYSVSRSRIGAWAIPAVVGIVFAAMTFQRTKVWKDSDTLWTDVISRFPNAPVPRTNRANYLITLTSKPEYKEMQSQLLQRALEDCNMAEKANANHAKTYENRQNIYLRLNKDTLALADANTLIRLEPGNRLGYYTKGAVYQRIRQPDSAIIFFNKCLEINPNTDFALNNRGSLLFNHYKNYKDALADFNRAIQINPKGEYHLNRSYCHYQLGQLELAKMDARVALQKGQVIPDNYRQLLKL